MRWLCLLFVAGCGPGPDMNDMGDPHDPLHCGPQGTIVPVANEGQMHVPYGTPVAYKHNPPASGPHWPWTHPWGAYDQIIPREWWVHNLEHGGVVLLFNCGGLAPPDYDAWDRPPDDMAMWPCPEVTTPLRTLLAERTPDKFGEVRMLVTGNDLAPKKVSAVAWGWVYQSDTVDLDALRCFRDARYGQGPEDAQ